MDADTFADVGRAAAAEARAEIYEGLLYGALVETLRLAESVWYRGATREVERRRRFGPGYRERYTAEERFAEQLLERIGVPDAPCPDWIEAVARAAAERERLAAW